jgi:hypothetical protein
MGFADEGPSDYPIVQCDLTDILGAPGMPAPVELARALSTPRHRWSAVAGGDALFLTTSTAGAGAFAPFEEQLSQPLGSERVQHTFRSGVCSQQTHQQTLRDKPVVGARFRTVSFPQGSVVLGGPVADLSRRDPGAAPRHSVAAVTRAVRDHLKVTDSAKISLERVIFPHDGRGVWAYRAKVTDRSAALDVRAYVQGDKELSLLYAQDVSCAASFGEGRVFRVNPARHPAPEVVRLAGLEGARGVLTTSKLKLVPAVGKAFANAKRDFRLEPDSGGFEEVCAFHHMATAMQFFSDLLGPDVFDDEPFVPLTIRVQDRTVSRQVGVFFPGQNAIALADQPAAARSGDICVHEFTHAVVRRVARLDDEFASPVARGLNEGFADYAQATLYDDPRFGDWVRDQPEGARRCDDPDLRLMARPTHSLSDRYAVGAAWAALLWDFRGRVGPGIADAVAFHSLHFLEPRCTYDHARQALHHADRALFPALRAGRHKAEIDGVFDARLAR